jgi:hypothetical protein
MGSGGKSAFFALADFERDLSGDMLLVRRPIPSRPLLFLDLLLELGTGEGICAKGSSDFVVSLLTPAIKPTRLNHKVICIFAFFPEVSQQGFARS